MIEIKISELPEKFMIGGHISAAGGVEAAPERASIFGFRTFQFFTKNQMRWVSLPLKQEQINDFRENIKKYAIKSTMAHASYLLNLGSSDPDLRKKSINGLQDEVNRCNELGVSFLTVHPGSAKDRDAGIKLVNDALQHIDTGNTFVLIENMAGQGNVLGSTLQELGKIIDGLPGNFGICIDTCHAWAAGYDIKSRDGYQNFMDEAEETFGLEKIHGFHLNDSKGKIGSRLDRHELIGLGFIADGLYNVITDDRFANSPKIMETPEGEAGYMENLERIREMLVRSKERNFSDNDR
ncbi:MAG: deoxyribonuclease IV [Thermoplasmata archaeon]